MIFFGPNPVPKKGYADTGYLSETNIDKCTARGVEPFMATGRESRHSFLKNRLRNDANEVVDESKLSKIEKIKRKLKSKEGKKVYRYRKMTVEPAFGIIQPVMGFRPFSFRGLEKVAGEWGLVSIAYNLRRLLVLKLAF